MGCRGVGGLLSLLLLSTLGFCLQKFHESTLRSFKFLVGKMDGASPEMLSLEASTWQTLPLQMHPLEI